jgi:glucosamine kinase
VTASDGSDGSGVFAVDGGQTGLRACVEIQGRTATAEVGGFGYAAGDPVETIAELLRQAWAKLPGWARTSPSRASLGLTGEHGGQAIADLTSAVAGITGAQHVRVAHDSVTAHLGALAGKPGVVVACGTGTVALSVKPNGGPQRVDGWGSVLGDAGSGFAVGRSALRAACASQDGRGEQTILVDLAIQRYGPLKDLPRVLYRSESLAADVAAFTVDAATAARAGDVVAQRIWSSAVDNLTATTLAAASTWQTTQLLISYTGGMFDVSDLVLVPWVAQVRMARPGAVVSAPVGNGLDGALRLATLADPGAWTDLLWYDGAP